MCTSSQMTLSHIYCANRNGAHYEMQTNNTCVILNSSSDVYRYSVCDLSHLKGLVPCTAKNQL